MEGVIGEPLVWIGGGLAAAALAGEWVLAGLKRLWGAMTAANPGGEDAEDFAAARRLKQRFDRLRCPEGQQAVVTIMQHFWHDCGEKR
ncbi:MAG: hypothetical protein N2439_11325 [Anaerolineae bacterium]|nr:hypothetical protein [Anaerolineae bacterium]